MPNPPPSGRHHPGGERIRTFVNDFEDSFISRVIAGRSTIPVSLTGSRNSPSSKEANSQGTSKLVEGSNFSHYSSLPGCTDGTDSVTGSIATSFGERALNDTFHPAYVDAGTRELPAYPPLRSTTTPVLQCPFEILGCKREFHREHESEWIDHSIDHFVMNDASRQKFEPPRQNSCCFCEKTFQSENGTVSWKQRMMHIAGHHRVGHSLAHARPNFSLLIYLWQKGVIDTETYRDIRGKTPDRSRVVANASPPLTEVGDEIMGEQEATEEEEEGEESGTETVTNIYNGRRDRRRRLGTF